MMNLRRLSAVAFLLLYFSLSPLFSQATPHIFGMGTGKPVTVTTSNEQSGTSGKNTLSNEGFLPNNNAASRFLQQAGFGPNYNEIMALSSTGMEDWLDAQFALPRGFDCVDKVTEITNVKNAGLNTPDGGAWDWFWDYAYWEYSMNNSDVLRQRIALALSEILVISENSGFGEAPYPFASFYDLLLDHAFGNYRDLLEAVTLQPAMGMYLTYMNNPKQDTIYQLDWSVYPPDTLNIQYIFPDENYAREVMQLFTIGLCELNIDGSCQKDGNGVDVPTYDNVDIAEFSKIFTGLTWATPWCDFGCGSLNFNGDVIQNMVMNNDYHEPAEKRLLNGTIISPKNPVDGLADISEALDNLFNHPNVGPFIGKLLIQRLVTSNPSPGYVTRVAQAFNGESHYSSQRGDMRALIKAILLDDEARDCAAQNDPQFGKLREPFIRYLQLCHSFDLASVNGPNRNVMNSIYQQFGQKIFTSPSVFNFFQQDYQPIGPVEEAGLFAPEFQITNSQTISGYMNALNNWLFRGNLVDDWGRGFEEAYDPNNRPTLNLSAELGLTADSRLPELIDRLNLILAHGQLSQRSKDVIMATIREMPNESDFHRQNRVNMAIYLVMASPEYLISK